MAKMRRAGRTTAGLLAGVVLVVLGVAGAAAVSILTQTFPATPSGTAAVVTGCATLNVETPTSTITGTAGTVQFDCAAAAGTAAFTASSGTVTPTFTLPGGTTSLSIATWTAASTTCSPGTTLTSGTSVTFGSTPPTGDYVYCLSYTSYPSGGIAGFSLTWAQ